MKERESPILEDMRDEYDLDRLPVRRLGPGRRDFGPIVRLDEDVAALFPDANSVNEALRLVARVLRENAPS
jgi:hypothetical protein